jgi:DNA (cytosine-5)-methyltransferase 1
MNVLDLFSGIGGFSLGLERAGMRTVAFCEIEPRNRAVLKKHWPHVHCYEDVRELTADRLRADGIAVDAICGGFPCQDISVAGKRAGIDGARSGLWSEYARIIGEVRPRCAIVENVSGLLNRGLERVLGDLATLGYDAEWNCIPASAVGALHVRDRIWIIAYPGSERADDEQVCLRRGSGTLHAHGDGSLRPVADADRGHRNGWPGDVQMGRGRFTREIAEALYARRDEWPAEPDVGRVAYGVPARLDRLCSLGNAVIPQIPEIIGRAIMKHADLNK